jgi:5-methylcytosine-specific restriction endonuclease McrA
MGYTRYTQEQLEEAASNSESLAGCLRYLGMKVVGGNQTHMRTRLDRHGIDTSHFTGKGHSKGKQSNNRRTAEDILTILPEGSYRAKSEQLRRAMIECGVLEECQCGITNSWNGNPIQLEVDHIDGDWYNNVLENLRFLCPNCHSQEPTNKSWRKS